MEIIYIVKGKRIIHTAESGYRRVFRNTEVKISFKRVSRLIQMTDKRRKKSWELYHKS